MTITTVCRPLTATYPPFRSRGSVVRETAPARPVRRLVCAAALLALLGAAAPAGAQCIGDCNSGGTVSINELILGVNIALGGAQISACPAFDPDESNRVTIADLIAAVNAALNGCPATPTATVAADTPTETPTAPADTPTATATLASTATASSTATPVATDTAEPTATATSEPTVTATSEPTATATAEPATPTVTATPVDTESPSPTPTLGEPATATATPSATFTATASPTSGPGFVCGNGFLEPGETCESCAADCVVGSCVASATSTTFDVTFDAPPATGPTAVTFLVGYQSTRVSLPGSGAVTSVRQRITVPQPLPNVFSPNDLDYALRLVLGRNAGFSDGLAFSLRFDQCTGAAPVTAADFACTIEGCASGGGPIADCRCTVTAQ